MNTLSMIRKNTIGPNIAGMVPIKNAAPSSISSIPRYIGFLV